MDVRDPVSEYLSPTEFAFWDDQTDITIPHFAFNQCNQLSTSTCPQSPQLQLKFLEALELSPSVVDYLLGLYFSRYQIMLNFVSQQDFMAQKAMGSGPMLRESLVLAMLAIALRYSTRPEVNHSYTRPDGENVLASAAKKALETELRYSDITTIKTLLILAEVETSAGNDMTGYLYNNLASSLILQLGSDLGSMTNHSIISLANQEIDCRHWIVWAASVGDQYWSVTLKQPLNIKAHILQSSRLAVRFARSGDMELQNPSLDSYEQQVHEYFFALLELSREITDSMYASGISKIHMRMSSSIAKFSARLEHWYALLPERIRRGPVSGDDSYHFLFIMHLLYNANKIVLYRDVVQVPDTDNFSDTESTIGSVKTILVSAAIRIARLCEMFRRRDDVRILQSTGAQWASLAAYVLIEHTSSLPADEVVKAVAHLQSLTGTLKEMSRAFKSALEAHQAACLSLHFFNAQLNGDDELPEFLKILPTSAEYLTH